MKYIAVFCSANDLEEKYTKPAKEFAKLFAENKYNLIWGGSNHGLMKIMADGVQQGGGKIVGISMKILRKYIRKEADETIIVRDLGERKALILKRSDAIVVLMGGVGTLDEMTEIMELKKHQIHNKPIVILNTRNFYKGLKMQFEKMEKEGFLPRPLQELLYFADTPNEAITYLNKELK